MNPSKIQEKCWVAILNFPFHIMIMQHLVALWLTILIKYIEIFGCYGKTLFRSSCFLSTSVCLVQVCSRDVGVSFCIFFCFFIFFVLQRKSWISLQFLNWNASVVELPTLVSNAASPEARRKYKINVETCVPPFDPPPLLELTHLKTKINARSDGNKTRRHKYSKRSHSSCSGFNGA